VCLTVHVFIFGFRAFSVGAQYKQVIFSLEICRSVADEWTERNCM